ncbi:MAG: PilX N-terminal domain-containing pilus assembly protein [bacterium]
MKQLTGTRERGNAGTRNNRGERGSALVTVLILIIVLTLIGAAMLTVTLTELTIAFNQADAAIARALADAGMNRAAIELATNLTWAGTGGPISEGDGTYDVVVTASGSTRYITSTGVRGGGRQILRGSFKAVPRVAASTVLANTTATIGAATTGLTVSNTMPSPDATAAHANRILGGATAMTINTTGATVIGGLTSNGGSISGVSCATWPWRCNTAFGTIPVKQINADSGGSSLKSRAQATFDGGKSLYFRGGDTSPGGCKGTPGYNFGLGQTQRCWDQYVNNRGGIIGSTIPNAVFFIEFNADERMRYTMPTLAIGFIATVPAGCCNNAGGAASLTIPRPGAAGVANQVLIAAVSVRGGSGTTITPPAAPFDWTLVRTIDSGATLRMEIYYRVTTAAEPANYTWNFSSVRKASGGIMRFSNVDLAAPIDEELGQATTTTATGGVTALGITTTIPNTRLVGSFAVATGTTFTPPGGMAERYDSASTGGGAGSRTTSEGAEVAQAAAGPTGTRTADTPAAGGIAAIGHLLALRPGGPTVDCVGYSTTLTESLCLRARPATDSNNTVVYANSDVDQVTGAIVAFRRGAGTAVTGNIVLEDLSLHGAAGYIHTSLGGDPALVAGGAVGVISSGSAAGPLPVDVIGLVYAFAGLDNPDVNGNLLGSAGPGIVVLHAADQVTLTFHGFLISNGTITLQDTATNTGTVSVLYDAAVADALPAVFTASSIDNVIFSISWSSGD